MTLRWGDARRYICLPFVRQMTPTHPSHHTTTSHVSSVAVLMWNNVVSVGSERYRQLWYSGYRYQNSRWPFAFHLSHTRHQRVAQIFALPVLQLWPCRQLFWWGVFGSFSFSLFKRLLEHGFLPWASGCVQQFWHFYSVLIWSNRKVWLHLVACVKFIFKDSFVSFL